MDQIAQGRVWDGGTARQLGLVDGFGGMEEAIAKAAALAKLDKGERGVRYLERPVSLRDSVIEMLATEDLDDDGTAPTDAFAAFGRPEAQLAVALADLRAVLSGPRIQVRCLECAGDAPPPNREDRGFLAALLRWLSGTPANE